MSLLESAALSSQPHPPLPFLQRTGRHEIFYQLRNRLSETIVILSITMRGLFVEVPMAVLGPQRRRDGSVGRPLQNHFSAAAYAKYKANQHLPSVQLRNGIYRQSRLLTPTFSSTVPARRMDHQSRCNRRSAIAMTE